MKIRIAFLLSMTLFVSQSVFAGIKFPIGITDVHVQRINKHYYRTFMYMPEPCLFFQVFNDTNDYTMTNPISEFKFCRYKDIDFNNDVSDVEFSEIHLIKDGFMFDFEYSPRVGFGLKHYQCKATVNNQKILAPICNEK